jgi:hypothetical protein
LASRTHTFTEGFPGFFICESDEYIPSGLLNADALAFENTHKSFVIKLIVIPEVMKKTFFDGLPSFLDSGIRTPLIAILGLRWRSSDKYK